MNACKRILFVCLGNIVRSPLAEAVFLHMAAQGGVGDEYGADSAGRGGWHAGFSRYASTESKIYLLQAREEYKV